MKRFSAVSRPTLVCLSLATAALSWWGCPTSGEELGELRDQQRQILAKLGDLEKKIDKIGAKPAARQRRAGPDTERAYNLPVGKSPVRGAAEGAITIVEFSDYQCPFCSRAEPLIDQALEAYPTQARFVYKHLPLTSIHPHAMGAAHAAAAAQKQGKFWEMHALLFANQRALQPEKLKEYAQQLGLDAAQFEADMNSDEIKQQVQEDMRLGQSSGVRGTPTIFVNGKLLQNRSLDGFKQIIDPILKQKAEG